MLMHHERPAHTPRTKLMPHFGATCDGGQSAGAFLVFGLACDLIDYLSRRVTDNLPRGLQTLQDDLQRNLRAGLEAALSRLNLVTREEFEIQQAVLQRTREKVKALEARVAALETTED